MTDRPGIVIYFELSEALQDFSDEEAGMIFRAMLLYGQTGAAPDFSDRALRTLWRNVQQKIDRDAARYQDQVAARKYAVFVREWKRHHEDEPMSFEAWKQQNDQAISNDRFDIQLQPEPELQLQSQREAKTATANSIPKRELEHGDADFETRRQMYIQQLKEFKAAAIHRGNGS